MVFQSKVASVIKRLDQTRGQPPGTPPQLALRSAARAFQIRKQRILTQLPERMHDIDMYHVYKNSNTYYQGHTKRRQCVSWHTSWRELVGMLDYAYLGNGTSIVSDAAVCKLDGDKCSHISNENTE